MATYKGYDLFLNPPNWITPVSHNYNHPYDLLQSLGLGYAYSNYGETLPGLKGEWLEKTKAEQWEIIEFFDDKMGRFGGFWLPSWTADIIVTSPFLAADQQLVIEDIEYASIWLLNDVTGRYITILWPDDTYVCKKIVGAPVDTIITLDETIDTAADADMLPHIMVSFLHFVRFDQDEIEAKYITRDVAQFDLRFRDIPSTFVDPGVEPIGPIKPSNGSYLDEDCSDISDWNDADSGTNAESSQITYDSKSCFKFDSGNAASGNLAHRTRDIGSYGNRVVFSLSVYHDALGTIGDVDYFVIVARKNNVMFQAGFATDGLFIHDGSSWNEVGTNLVQTGVWQEWAFDCDFTAPASATCDVYLDGVLQASGVDCSRAGSWVDGWTQLAQYGYATANRITYVDWVKVGDDFA